jgi:hypothetical protein
MKTNLFAAWSVVLFAAWLPAQQGKLELPKELAAAAALEDQEHDLGKAEAKYRELLDGGKLDAPARAYASLRLGQLLVRLGKKDEAKPFLEAAEKSGVSEVAADAKTELQGGEPDAERVKALREKAKEIVARVMAQNSVSSQAPSPSSTGYGISDAQAVRDLLWIGVLGEPEIVTALTEAAGEVANGKKLDPNRGYACLGLAGLLWKMGGTKAAEFLRSAATHPVKEWRRSITQSAGVIDRADMTDVAQLFLSDPDPEAFVQRPLPITRFSAIAIIDAAAVGNDALRSLVIGWLADRWQQLRHEPDEAATLHRFLPILDKALLSTNPQVGQAAQRFLSTFGMGASVDGLLLFLREAPGLPSNSVPYYRDRKFAEAEARELLPKVLEAGRALGVRRGQPTQLQEGLSRLFEKIAADDPDCDFDTSLALIDLGYSGGNSISSVVRRAPPERARDVLRAWTRMGHPQALTSLRVSPDLWPWLREFAAEAEKDKLVGRRDEFSSLAVRTGQPEVADWLMEVWGNEPFKEWRLSQMIGLGRLSKDERVRSAIVRLCGIVKPEAVQTVQPGSVDPGPSLARSFLALASMGDVRAFDVMNQRLLMTIVSHPYAKQQEILITPLQYLIYEKSDPPIGFTPEQIVAALRDLFAKKYAFPPPANFTMGRISNAALLEITRNQMQHGEEAHLSEWVTRVASRLAEAEDPEIKAPGGAELRKWFETCLSDPESSIRYAALVSLDRGLTLAFRTAVEARLGDDSWICAKQAARDLFRADIANDAAWLDRLLKSRHPEVRVTGVVDLADRLGDKVEGAVLPCLRDKDMSVRVAACHYFAKILSQTAVPELLSLMRDPEDNVAKAATDALAKIRLYHDQQAHWDRVIKGLDASSANATEKLLLQAKPTAPHDQRLLAIRSLGALGAPESLPFLIDWITDTDAEIAAAARAAITAIHQKTGAK